MSGPCHSTVLPGILAEIAEVAGPDAALLVAKAKGGHRAYFPRDPDCKHWLSKLLGHERAIAVCERLAPGDSGIELEVPLGPMGSRARRWAVIAEMTEAGKSKPEIASVTGVHHKTVQRHRARLRCLNKNDDQGELF